MKACWGSPQRRFHASTGDEVALAFAAEGLFVEPEIHAPGSVTVPQRAASVRAVVQRVSSASVEVAGEAVARIDAGLLALVAVGREDSQREAEELARKIIHLRIFEDDEGRMNQDLVTTGGALCLVSQFTLFGDVRKGRRPFFGDAADPERAEPLIAHLAKTTRVAGVVTETGRFGARMAVSLVNDGPVTILLDTQKRF